MAAMGAISGESAQAVGIIAVRDLIPILDKVQIVDARPHADFAAGHIPGALPLAWEDWCDPAPAPPGSILRRPGYWGTLRSASADWYAERLSAQGLNDRDRIVVYADGPRSRGREGRTAWMLLYLGAASVALLDGGWRAWLAAGGELEREEKPAARGRFRVSFRPQRRRTLGQLAEQCGSGLRPLFVDTRSEAEFGGGMQEFLPRRGHIAGAVLVPFTTLFDADETYVDRATYRAEIAPRLRRSEDLVAYCEVGVRAALFALLHEAYTGATAPVYDGSLVEWACASELPLEELP
jgi:thiosulfate/3-mercaptopyruvate sulfurtransferase